MCHEGEARMDVLLAFQALVDKAAVLAKSEHLLYWSDGLSTMLTHQGVSVYKVKSISCGLSSATAAY